MNRYALRVGEPLAISSDAIRRDADGLFMLLGGEPPENETRGSVAIVNIRGALQQFEGRQAPDHITETPDAQEAFLAQIDKAEDAG